MTAAHGPIPAPAPGPGFDAAQATAMTGLTYQQLDVWTRAGRIHADHPHPGTGHGRRWTYAELVVAATMRRLTDAGLDVRVASRVARNAPCVVELADGVHMHVSARPLPEAPVRGPRRLAVV